MKQPFVLRYWRKNIINISFSVLALIGLEWLFLITKPSFLSLSPVYEKLAVLIVSIVFVTAFLVLLSIPFVLIGTAINRNNWVVMVLITIIPAFVYTCFGLLLIDNFTYTLFKVGVINSTGIGKIAYIFGLILLFGYSSKTIYSRVKNALAKDGPTKPNNSLLILSTFTIILSCVIVFPSIAKISNFGNIGLPNQEKATQPNIILITPDGVNASHLNVYGYERQTTPFLSSIKEKLIISQDHFTNSGVTSGSITSMLTSKLPTTTRVLYSPDILRGTDTIEHLPAILKGEGYYVAQFGVKHYVDAIDLNLQNGFMEVNGVSINSRGLAYQISQKFPSNSKLFLQEVESRLIDRFGHILFIKDMENTYTQITKTQSDYKDIEKIQKTVNLIENHQEPVFVHIHWMGTHGGRFYPVSTMFSQGIDRTKQDVWNQELYDDAIVDFDSGLSSLFNSLKEINELNNTLIIITSDHGQGWTTTDRLPLILFMPGTRISGIPTRNTQNIDISPTILDILNLPKPSWMQGRSIFNSTASATPLTAVTTHYSINIDGKGPEIDPEYAKPPFYQFDSMTIIDCDKAYSLDLENLTWTREVVQDYSSSCLETNYLPTVEIRQAVIDRFKQDKFEFEIETIPAIPADY